MVSTNVLIRLSTMQSKNVLNLSDALKLRYLSNICIPWKSFLIVTWVRIVRDILKGKKIWKKNTARIFYAYRHAILRRWWVIIECHDVHQNATWSGTRISRHRFILYVAVIVPLWKRLSSALIRSISLAPTSLAAHGLNCTSGKVSSLRPSVSRVLRNFFSLSHKRTIS